MDDNDQGYDDQGYMAYQQELEHRRFEEECGSLCPDNKELKNYSDKHGV